MAVYKVPQDVEAEDKLIGPFSFRQFIYLVIVALGLFLMWVLSRIFIGLVLIPLPFVLFFGALALPLRKDQPMEIYLAAMVKFFFKPKIRLWQPEGQINFVTITAPKVSDAPALKEYSGEEAQRRLAYLAQIVDTQGWATRGVTTVPNTTSLSDDIVADASHTDDVMDNTTGIGQQFDSLIEEQDSIRKQMALQNFQQAIQASPGSTTIAPVLPTTLSTDSSASNIDYNPYPSAIHQRVINPDGRSTPTPHPSLPSKTSEEPVSPDIIRLATNNDLSISAIAREARRIEDKHDDEVIISLR